MTSFHFPVTPWMSPGLRLLAFSVRGSAQRPEVITDSTWLDIAEQCGQEVSAFSIHSGILGNRIFIFTYINKLTKVSLFISLRDV